MQWWWSAARWSAVSFVVCSPGCTNEVPFDGFMTSATGTASATNPTEPTAGPGGTMGTADGTADGTSLDGTAEGGPKLDVSNDSSGNGCEGGGGGGELEFSYIWIANSPDSTISKIDTITATEVGRYTVAPAPAGTVLIGPSRTSVSVYGDMVVADRSGGLAKVWARHEDCPDLDGDGMVDTSTNSTPLPFGSDECLAWRIDIPRAEGIWENRRGPRAVQWTGPLSCDYEDSDVWVAFCNELDDDVTVWLVDGETGDVEVEIPIPNFQCEMMGPYGGAIDPDNNFWFVDGDTNHHLYRADIGCEPGPGSPCWERFEKPDANMDAYGITVDRMGRVWMAGQGNSLYYYWPQTGQWENFKPELDQFFGGLADGMESNILRGLMMDADDTLWIATVQAFGGGPFPGVLRVDTTTTPFTYDFYGKETLGNELQHAAGISIDVEDHVWLVDTFSNAAYKIPPAVPASYVRVGGLNQPYTYSDMTGFGLLQVYTPPAG
ncbi:NHL repeat-containing protein [Paraliomyxa miuraensis]|uniref:hypothetical protein n=1 Tax=Paraliomyxa miuraensis TaxID=376150 RepID=UPI00225009AC|nr:hypothetical protein [Paraliomyxa miuraensis]MCX4244864.1 hypothetical protein [Paraliomyxa miuraensis]